MARSKKSKGGVIKIDKNEVIQAVSECIKRFRGLKEKQYVASLLYMMLMNNSIPIKLLEHVPIDPKNAGKTRFDQLYDAAMDVAFPGYRKETLDRLLGPGVETTNATKVWRIIFPDKFKLAHLLIRADSYQEAFALACDYACRASLRMNGKIPPDLTIRVMFVTEKAIRRKLDIRWANRVNKRRQLQLVGRTFSPKELHGARIAALGPKKSPCFSIAKYVEVKDLDKLLKEKNTIRVSSIESEVFED